MTDQPVADDDPGRPLDHAAEPPTQPPAGASGQPAAGPAPGSAAGSPPPAESTAAGSAGGPGPGQTASAGSGGAASSGPRGASARWGLVRPRNGRQIAGVCAAIGRATGTDPMLWRVLLAVLAVFGGAGLVAYGVGWLLLPEEGDTASPLEALFGRGRSRTNPAATVLVGLVTVAMLVFTMNGGFRPVTMLAALVVGVVLLRNRRAGAPPDTAPATAAPTTATPEGYGYRPPFSPHGPYGGTLTMPVPPTGEYAEPQGWGMPYAAPYPEPAQPVPTPRRRERSPLGWLTFSAILLVLGVMGLLHALGLAIPVAAFFLVALALAGAGLVVGAWFGRAYRMIPIGLVAAVGLAVSTVAPSAGPGTPMFGAHTWTPQSVAAVDHRYLVRFGEGTVDLSHVDFTGQTVNVEVVTDAANTTVILPPTVDANIATTVFAGHALVLGTESHGGPRQTFHVTDFGADGKGGGTLNLRLLVRMGNTEVRR